MKFSKIALIGLCLVCVNGFAATNKTTAPQPQPAVQAPQDINKTTGDAFLMKNKSAHGVVTLPDGLQYKILTKGNGPKPTVFDTVVVDYEGTLVDGTVFDSSYKRGEPIEFQVNGVIPGWVEALQLMPVGSTWMLYIPSNLAYGEHGAPPSIPPNATLVFKVQLHKIKK